MPRNKEKNTPDLLIDLTRLIGRFLYGYLPTGIDRVTIAYAKHYREKARVFVYFKSQYAVFPYNVSGKLFGLLTERYQSASKWEIISLLVRGVLFSRLESNIKGKVLLNIDHMGLDHPAYKKVIHRLSLRAIYVLHDLIPISYPEYCRAGDDQRHQVRIDTMLTTGMGIITNSQDTLDNLKWYAKKNSCAVPHSIVASLAPPAINISFSNHRPLSEPYFVMLSTIEPRKNHSLILHIWRDLSKQLGEKTPILVIIGKRGWECENIVDLLDRSPELKNTVVELDHCKDDELSCYLQFSQALLFPSFVEGFGLPLVEALLHKTPVIASDLSVFKEIAGDIPEYINPLDGKAWKEMIIDYSDSGHHLRVSQQLRIRGFTMPTWEQHFKSIDSFISSLY